ncbi:signal peptidase I [Paenibacillus selenitireducens]|uniref:Signal peptidase I n=1 Tax=Paenibacillus selenitireducens TaxID=1324314 RepID=A0A1T2XAI9_9BACL|nr:signal peptidase I [Paenibacillus selenitireducens]OPA76850.1 signal peptidase I [Paenibacillus selenitireducens]
MKTLKKIISWVSTFGVGFVLALIIGIFVIQPYKVDGHSMDPTLNDQQRIYVSKLSHSFSYLPKYGDIVVIDSRVERSRDFKDDLVEHPLLQLIMKGSLYGDHTFYVKRVLGKPGDVLEFKEHRVYRNGVALEEPYIKEAMNYVSDSKWIVPEKHIFVMGDNRNNSRDSRDIGYIPLDHVMGIKIFPS